MEKITSYYKRQGSEGDVDLGEATGPMEAEVESSVSRSVKTRMKRLFIMAGDQHAGQAKYRF